MQVPEPSVPSFLEIFCGHAGLTKAMSQEGWRALGVDYHKNKDKPIGSSVTLDLSTEAGQKAFWQLVEERKVLYVHFAPPCGTASRAREKRLRSGFDPKPLRSDEAPDGIPGIPVNDRERVYQANLLYEFVASACKILSERGIFWSIENPKNSLLWKTSWMSTLQSETSCSEVHFQHCMHGGTRDKRTMLLVSQGLNLAELTAECDGKHKHSPWGI